MVLPHGPLVRTPHSKSLTKQDRFGNRQERFADMVAYTDYLVGRLLDRLDMLGLSNNTLVLFTGDNGTARAIESGFEQRTIQGGKGSTKDAGTRVPLFARWTGQVPAGRVSDDLIEFSDFFATLSDLARRPLPESEVFDGRSFLPQLRGEKGNPRDWIFMHFDKNVGSRPKPVRFARTKRFKLYSDGRFFDVPNDWEEQRPLQSLTPEQTTIQSMLQRVLDSMPLETATAPIVIGLSGAVSVDTADADLVPATAGGTACTASTGRPVGGGRRPDCDRSLVDSPGRSGRARGGDRLHDRGFSERDRLLDSSRKRRQHNDDLQAHRPERRRDPPLPRQGEEQGGRQPPLERGLGHHHATGPSRCHIDGGTEQHPAG